jgi:predicted DCC family thiol-disulfide oxidoreductase YuxK
MAWVVFFDGNCGFCSWTVRQVFRLDRHARITFAPLQGDLAREHGFSKYADEAGGTMVVLRETDGKVFTHSDGLIELARAFGGGWRVLTVARFIPKWLRDAGYRWIAHNRYRLMGRADASCALPDPALLKRLRQ